jgi:outer membrane cobalamin receptor
MSTFVAIALLLGQLQLGEIRGVAKDETDAVLPGATIELTDALGAPLVVTQTDGAGRFVFASVAPGRYRLQSTLPGFRTTARPVTVTNAIPVEVTLHMRLGISGDPLQIVAPDTPATRASIGGESLASVPVRAMSKGLQEAVATLPGWSTEDNGLLHVRGTDDGFLYVIDGVPVYERLDQLSGLGPNLGTVEAINVITGYIPAEYGYKAGGVIDVQTKSAHQDWSGLAQIGRGSSGDTHGTTSLGGPLSPGLTLTAGAAAQQSSRFLDSVHPDNLHNEGHVAGGAAQLRWVRPNAEVVSLSAGGGRTKYDVPNTAEQEDEEQDQEQRVSQAQAALSWQRAWSSSTYSQVSAYLRDSSVQLLGSDSDTPLHANATRSLQRAGVVAGLSRQAGGHTIKAGVDAQRLVIDEDFNFFVTDADQARDAGFSDAALRYTSRSPFAFADRATPVLWSAFLQDDWHAGRFTLSGGLRFDASRVLLERYQFSPRLGATYRANLTVLRGSVSRFFQPPQPENLLLSSSPQAQELSPFAEEGEPGGADIEPERQWAYEAGVEHHFGRMLRADVAIWYRSVRDAADPNVFAGTTIIFPNAVARGRARGLDARLELIRHQSWSGYVNLGLGHVRQTGPITGGLFLEDEVAQLGEGVEFIPDHDQKISAGGGVSWTHARHGGSVAATVRYESGSPTETDDDDLEELRERPGAELVDFEAGRVKPRTIVSIQAAWPLFTRGRRAIEAQASLLNLFDARYAFNFGNPFSGTHFGAPRTMSAGLRFRF